MVVLVVSVTLVVSVGVITVLSVVVVTESALDAISELLHPAANDPMIVATTAKVKNCFFMIFALNSYC